MTVYVTKRNGLSRIISCCSKRTQHTQEDLEWFIDELLRNRMFGVLNYLCVWIPDHEEVSDYRSTFPPFLVT